MNEESTLIFILGAILYATIAYTCIKTKLSFIHLISLFIIRISLPLIYLQDSYDFTFIIWLLLSSIFLMLGFLISTAGRSSKQKIQPTIILKDTNAIQFALAIGLVFVIYHYSIVGIPMFSENLDMARFQQRESGLFGIPSRFAVYFPSLILITSVLLYQSKNIGQRTFYFWILTALFIFTAQGNKSSILSFLFVLLCTKRFWAFPVVSRKLMIAFTMIGLGFLYYIFGKYSTLADSGFADYIIQRMTYISLEPIYTAFQAEGFNADTVASSIIINDLTYPIAQLLGFDGATFNTQLSRHIYGFDSNQFSVPVTPSILAYYKYEFGTIGSIFACLATGMLIGKLYLKSNSTRNAGTLSIFVFCEYQIYTGLGSGNLFYMVLNVAAVVLIYKACITMYGRLPRKITTPNLHTNS
nr:O-antigen polymerase [uncultured Pseudomonas sp.]